LPLAGATNRTVFAGAVQAACAGVSPLSTAARAQQNACQLKTPNNRTDLDSLVAERLHLGFAFQIGKSAKSPARLCSALLPTVRPTRLLLSD
jgi:hypothetical protein